MPNKITKAFTSLFALLYPKLCLGCNTFLKSNEMTICTHCRHDLPITNYHLSLSNEMYQKFYGRLDLEFIAAMLYFHKKGIVQQMIHNLKYAGHQEIGSLLGYWYAEDIKPLALSHQFDIIIPVPLHKKRMRERGYNQVTAFGIGLSETLGIPFNSSILYRNFHSKTQTKKNFFRRTELKQDLFRVTFNESHHNLHFLLIDDVITSGATIEACGRALYKIPGAKISVVSIAYSHS